MTIYVIQVGKDGPVKIGFTASNPKTRRSSIQASHHATLILRGTIEGSEKTEKALHARFSATRIRGEWFAVSPELREFMENLTPVPPAPKPVGNIHKKLSPEDAKKLGRNGGLKNAALHSHRLTSNHKAIWRDQKYRTNEDAALAISNALGKPVSVPTIRRRFGASGRPGGWPKKK